MDVQFEWLIWSACFYITLPIECPDGFESYNYDCSCYNIVTSPEASRPDADKTCESEASHLVKIETPEEMTWLAGVYDLDSQYWCGANGLKEESKTWMDGTPVTFEGGFGDHDYTYDDESGCYRIVPAGVITDAEPNTWHDSPCNRKYGYICEYEDEMCLRAMETTSPEIVTIETTSRIHLGYPFNLSSVAASIVEGSRRVSVPGYFTKSKCIMKCTKVQCQAVFYSTKTRRCQMAMLDEIRRK
ncbi:putative C-type lectin domain family 4 member F-like [Apostichopus japonicus]|uniref:Putative C-type lectin domain family 4 member F-like n=1 Tax=Stichopus japonicus TaxID=307972 RepID=A0A2G8JPR6_STIJA|nr:putative C-type lectin domain family 4 member F-like [Apostichopus japonicus]